MRTDARVQSSGRNDNFTVIDQSFGASRSLGGKLGIWSSSLRRNTGLDFGFELDFTNYQPDIKTGPFKASGIAAGSPVSSVKWLNKVDVSSNLFALNLLGRIPLYVSEEFPHGRLYPYGGGGFGVQTSNYGSQSKTPADLAVQAIAGLHVFLTSRISFFGEYKYTHAKQSLVFGVASPSTTSDERYTFAVHHALFGFAYHFRS